MFNNLTIQGHLTANPVYRPGENGKKASCWGKIGVYQGTDNNGNELESMFIGFTCFGSEAEAMKDAQVGELVVVSGRFTESKSVSDDGREFMNKNVIGNARRCYKVPTQQVQQAPAAQPMPQQTYAQPAQQYTNPQNPNVNPWG